MNTHGHRRVAESVGTPRLRQAFEELGIKDVNLNAFYLGNWLTDLSQLNDPVAGCAQKLASEVGEKLRQNAPLLLLKYKSFITNELGKFVNEPKKPEQNALGNTGENAPLLAARKGELDPSIINYLVSAARNYVSELIVSYTALAALLKKPAQKNTDGESTGSSFSDALVSLVRFTAYSKFAHPDPQRGNPGIPYPIFDKIFKSVCVQYYPHEHLDRPECQYSYDVAAHAESDRSACADAWGEEFKRRYPDKLLSNRLGDRSTSPTNRVQSVYCFLEDDIKIASALLCEIDKEWASVYLTTGTDRQMDEAFHLGLAKLGHALHAVEDFFAHSNFIEHAAMLNGERYIKDKIYDSKVIGRAIKGKPKPGDALLIIKSDKAATKVRKRLMRYSPDVDEKEARAGWKAIPDETSVVTGYFDCRDTLISLSHVLEELLGIGEAQQEKDKTLADLVAEYPKKVFEDRLDEFKNPIEDVAKIVQDKTIEAKARRALIALLDYFSNFPASGHNISIQEVQTKIKDDDNFALLREYPKEIQIDVAKVIVILCTYQVDKVRLSFNAYQLIRTIVEFDKNPLGFLTEPLTSPGFNVKFAAKVLYHLFLRDTFRKAKYDLTEDFHEIVGAYRIGSHSLLAKDYENEPLYPQMFNCAKTLHWYVVDTICRWSDEGWTKTAKADSTWVDWKELLSYFLRHPATYHEEKVKSYYESDVVVNDHHVVADTGETFRSIYNRFNQKSSQKDRLSSYEDFLQVNLKQIDLSQLLAKDPVAGIKLDYSKIPQIVIQSGIGVPSANGSYELNKGLFVLIPFTQSAKRERIDKGIWYKDVMDLTDKQWSDFIESYRIEKSQLSFPAYQYHKWHYFESGKTGNKATKQRDAFIVEATKLRKKLEGAYKSKKG